jgi:hypothetical protein
MAESGAVRAVACHSGGVAIALGGMLASTVVATAGVIEFRV